MLLAACTTAGRPAGGTRGYTETQLGRNVFTVVADGNAQGSTTKATELCLLQCAEVTLAYGFSHFVILETANQPVTPIRVDTRTTMPTRSPSGGLLFVPTAPGVPSSANTIACFRKAPAEYPEAYAAETVFTALSSRYGVQARPVARVNPVNAAPLQFNLYPNFLLLPKTTPDRIVFLEPGSVQRTIVIGILNEWENPCETLQEFKHKAAVAAAILGAEAVQIQSDASPNRTGAPDRTKGFTAALLLVPKAHLGIQDDGQAWPRKQLVVRGFDETSLAPGAGLKVGDRIVELNGADVLRENQFVNSWLSWRVGEDVVVRFIRDGEAMSLQAKTIAN